EARVDSATADRAVGDAFAEIDEREKYLHELRLIDDWDGRGNGDLGDGESQEHLWGGRCQRESELGGGDGRHGWTNLKSSGEHNGPGNRGSSESGGARNGGSPRNRR